MLGEFKSDQLFAEKTKPTNNLYVENLNHLSLNKFPTHYAQQVISKITKENNFLLTLGNFKMINRLLKI